MSNGSPIKGVTDETFRKLVKLGWVDGRGKEMSYRDWQSQPRKRSQS